VAEAPVLSGGDEEGAAPPNGGAPQAPPTPARPCAIFLGHGKSKKPLDQLIKTLDQYGIPHKQAVEEANRGRPISQKVAETMRECGAAILIFSADEKFTDEDGDEIWRPSENVVNELGAASVLYDNRIIIFKESSVTLATNYRDIGYIEFEKDALDAKVNEL
jgi:predicted nucleotide-binding protein